MSAAAILYTLSDPRTPSAIRYVGWTSQRLRKRMDGHLKDARQGDHNHRCCWIRSLLADGQKPLMRAIAACGADEAPAVEIEVITALKALGHPLTNTTGGGEGMLGWNPTPETRAKMSAANLGKRLSPEHRSKMSAVRKGRPISAEQRIKLSRAMAGKKPSPQTIAASIASRLGRPLSPEHRARTGASLRAHYQRKREEVSGGESRS